MQGRMSPDQKPREVMGAHMVRPPPFRERAADGRCGHWATPERRQREGSLVRLESSRRNTLIAAQTFLTASRTHLIVGDVIIRAHALDLCRRQHPTHVVNDVEVRRGRLAFGLDKS